MSLSKTCCATFLLLTLSQAQAAEPGTAYSADAYFGEAVLAELCSSLAPTPRLAEYRQLVLDYYQRNLKLADAAQADSLRASIHQLEANQASADLRDAVITAWNRTSRQQ